MNRENIAAHVLHKRIHTKLILPPFYLFWSHFEGSKGPCLMRASKMGLKLKRRGSIIFQFTPDQSILAEYG